MSCSSCTVCNCNPCSCDTTCDPADEPISSALENFIAAFFGTITKSCVNGEVVWHLPCNLDTGSISGFPRLEGEGIACYFSRYLQTVVTGPQGPQGPTGPQGPQGVPGVCATGVTTSQEIVTNIDYTSPNIRQTKVTLTIVNGCITAISAPSTTIVTTAIACP